MRRDGVSWEAGVSNATITVTMGRAEAWTGATSVCSAGLRNSHPQKAHTVPNKGLESHSLGEPSLALSTIEAHLEASSEVCPAGREREDPGQASLGSWAFSQGSTAKAPPPGAEGGVCWYGES